MQNYTLIRSNRRTMELCLKPDGTVIVRAPLRLAKYRIDEFVNSKSDWILAKQQRRAERQPPPAPAIDRADIHRQGGNGKTFLRERTAVLSALMNAVPSAVKISDAKTRWGSCSGKNSINLNWRLMLCPPEVRDYVIIHELAHITHKNHGTKFWLHVAEFAPGYKTHRQWLRENGSGLMRMNFSSLTK